MAQGFASRPEVVGGEDINGDVNALAVDSDGAASVTGEVTDGLLLRAVRTLIDEVIRLRRKLPRLDPSGRAATYPAERTTAGRPFAYTVSTTAIVIAATQPGRKAIVITNNGTTDVYLGADSNVTSSGALMGLILKPGGAYSDSGDDCWTKDVYAISSATSSAQNVSVWERS